MRRFPFGAAALAAYVLLVWLPVRTDLALYALLFLGVLAVVLEEPARHPPSWPLPDAALLFYLLLSVVSIALAPDRLRALALSSALLPAAFLYVLATRYLQTPRMLLAVVYALAATAAALASSVLLTAGARWSPEQGSAALVELIASPILIVPNDVLWLACIAPLTLSLALLPGSALRRVLSGVVLVLIIAATAALQSRSALLGAMLGLGVTLLASGRMRRSFLWLLGGVALLLAAVIATDALLGFPLARKFSSLCFTRGPFWSAAWSLFLERPWLGHGAHSFVDLYQARLPTTPWLFCDQIEPRLTPWPHNLLLELLASQGLLGALPIVLTLVWAWLASLASTRRDEPLSRTLGAGLLGAWVVFTFAAAFELSLLRLWVVTGFALLLGLTIGLKGMTSVPRRPAPG